MVNLIPQCVKCGSPVSDLVEPEVEKQGQLKSGHYINNKWICDDRVQSNETKDGNMIGEASEPIYLQTLLEQMNLVCN